MGQVMKQNDEKIYWWKDDDIFGKHWEIINQRVDAMSKIVVFSSETHGKIFSRIIMKWQD